jgi:predicted ester cyclase
MTSKLDVVKAWLAQPISDNEARMAYIAEDFQNVDRDGNVVMDKAGLAGMGHMMLASFDDYDYKASEVREEGDAVIMTGHFEGTHTADIDLSLLGAGVVPASGKKIVWPEWSTKITVGQAKITRMEPYGEGGGMEAFLAPLGVKPPSK